MNKLIILLIVSVTFVSCATKDSNSVEFIESSTQQSAIFTALMSLTNNEVSPDTQDDSLAFLILPLEASCPSCRKKTIDSIIKHRNNFPPKHFIILTSNLGFDSTDRYFNDRKAKLPRGKSHFYIDSVNQARVKNLYRSNPSMYYTFQKKAFKKVYSRPETIREDLSAFFSQN